MDKVKAPDCLWYLSLKYVVQVLNHLATPELDNRTPIQKAFGVTPDISGLLQFYFYQPVFYLDTYKPSFPNSTELFGHWVGLAENIGDALTYWLLTPEYNLIARSTLCPAYQPNHQNLRMVEGEDVEVYGPLPDADAQVDPIEIVPNRTFPTVDPQNLIGFQFTKDHNGFPHKAHVIE